jgi:threonine dehydratase
LPQRATAAEEKRRTILDAAARVFARKGFHTSRVGDIAEEAGVAALLQGRLPRGRVGIVVSGGNVGAARFAELVRQP